MGDPTIVEPKTFTDWLRKVFGGVLNTIGGFLNQVGIHPNVVTILGWAGNFAAGVLAAFGYLTWAGVLALVLTPLDALDGTMARLRKEDGNFGAFIDSTADRYSEIALIGGLLWFYLATGSQTNVLLAFLTVTGSLMVSYMRARAESLGYSAKIGLMSRTERYIILIPGLLLRRPDISLWILAALTHFTALQRFFYVRRQVKKRPSPQE